MDSMDPMQQLLDEMALGNEALNLLTKLYNSAHAFGEEHPVDLSRYDQEVQQLLRKANK